MLSMYVHDNQARWDLFLPWVAAAYVVTPHPSTGVAPFEAMNGYLPKAELELNLPFVVQDIPRAVQDEVKRAGDIAIVRVTMDAELAAARCRQLEYYNTNRCDVTFK